MPEILNSQLMQLFSAALFCIGFFAVLTKKNLILVAYIEDECGYMELNVNLFTSFCENLEKIKKSRESKYKSME